MNLRHLIYFIALFMGMSAHAFELVMIQAVSETKTTFITRNGKRQGIIRGMTGTFTAEDISVLAKAVSVTGNFAQWELINKEARLPFEKGKIVTYYAANEYLWALTPESERKKYIKSEIPVIKQSMVFKGALTRGIADSVSDAPATTSRRGGFMGEIYYERDLSHSIAFDVGARYEQETINYTGASLITKRSLAIVDVIYYFDFMREYLKGKFFLAVGMGYGLSNTKTVGLSQSGPVGLLPAVKLGISLPFNDDWQFISDAAFESLQTSEEQESGNKQTTTQTNFKFGFGLRRYF
jgi:hypothetical protein